MLDVSLTLMLGKLDVGYGFAAGLAGATVSPIAIKGFK
jgi:hypothetical protein